MVSEDKKSRGTLIDIAGLEDSVGAKGINYDPAVEYEWTIKSREARKIVPESTDGHEGKAFTVVEIQCEESEEQGTIKQSFFYSKRVTVNEEDKSKESDAVLFARGMGYPVGVDLPFKWLEVFQVGLKFKAHVRKQLNRKTKAETGYMEIDLATVKPVKGGRAAPKQETISGSDEDRGVVIEMALGQTNKTALVGALNKAGKAKLINLALQMDKAGELSYQS